MDNPGEAESAVGQSGDKLARRFLDACAGIEETLSGRYNLSSKGLGQIVQDSISRDVVVRRNGTALRAFVELRNVLSHTAYRNGEPIAAPLPVTVEAIERLLAELTTPRRALEFASQNVLTARADDPLHELLTKMSQGDISQVPVVSESEVRLLTTNAIARWVAAHIESDGSVLIEAGVTADALAHAEQHEFVRLLKRSSTAGAALDLLTRDTPPSAVLITENGSLGEGPLGILTGADVPRLVEALTVAAI